MAKRVKSFLLAVLMMVLSVCTAFGDQTLVKADNPLTMKVHYHREDAAYDGWTVWLWEEGKDGADYSFADENGEMVATMEVTPGTTSVGFIVKTADWGKDIEADQFIDIAEMVSGTVHIYIESGVEGYTKEYDEDAVRGTKLKSAVYNGDGTITVSMTGQIAGDLSSVFKVAGKAGAVAISSVEAMENDQYKVTLAEKLINSKSYKITYEGTEYNINMPIIYSTEEFEAEYTYDGDDLGATWTKEKTSFRVWAPTAEKVILNLYKAGDASVSDLIEQVEMTKDVKGTWIAEKEGDLNGTYYTYTVTIDDVDTEACDPYARTTGINGNRAMVIDLDSTDPEGWAEDKNPHAGESITDAILYEIHVRDISASDDSGITNKGLYLGLTETGTKTEGGVATGLDHLKELGITHLHILPFYDYGSVDETGKTGNPYNWGYDPKNYNVPEGSYSSDPYNGEVRVSEVKQMVQALHENDISVVMDVVYNHVYNAGDFCFNKLVPGYFSRIDQEGSYSNGSGCGNDTASERSMVQKYIVESVNYWVEEYHIDGFRFDLVGLIDTETINKVVEEVHKTHPDVIFYGEGWTMNTSVTKEGYIMSTQLNSTKTPDFAYFNDTIRDGLKGNVFNSTETGFVSGMPGKEALITQCFLGAADWCKSPSQTINYASCHDNNTLYDRLQLSCSDATQEELISMNNLAAAIYMTAEGVPFMMGGEEMLRTKIKADGSLDSNSYISGDDTNALKWSTLEDKQYAAVNEYYKGLIAFRKAHGALRLTTAEDVANTVTALEGLDDNVVGFSVKGGINGETAEEMYIIFNANEEETTVELPKGNWNVYVNGDKAGTEVLSSVKGGKTTVEGISALILVKEDAVSSGVNPAVVAGILAGVLAAVVLVVVLRKKATKK